MKNKEEKKKKIRINIIGFIKNIPRYIKAIITQIIFLFRFFILLFFVSIKYFFSRNSNGKLNRPNQGDSVRLKKFVSARYDKLYNWIIKVFDSSSKSDITDSDLIFLAMKNLSMKKNRTYVTIGGMAIGFGAIILLLSAGYGFERLVISQIASLSEMKQIDVGISKGSPLAFNSKTIEDISKIENVSSVIPIITSVSKITFNNAVSDVIVYGVSSEYFKETGQDVVYGSMYKDDSSNIRSSIKQETIGEVAGSTSILISKKDIGAEISKVKYSINPLEWKTVYSNPDEQSKIIGYTKRESGKRETVEVWGKSYEGDRNNIGIDVEGNEYSGWIKDSFLIWDKKHCSQTDVNCLDGEYVSKVVNGKQSINEGYITKNATVSERYEIFLGSPLEIYTGKVIEEIEFSIKGGEYINIYLDSQEDSEILSLYNPDSKNRYEGNLVYSFPYDSDSKYSISSSNGKTYGYWIETTLNLWIDSSCSQQCDSYFTTKQNNNDKEATVHAYLKASDLIFEKKIEERLFGQVLGDSDIDSNTKGSFIDLEALTGQDDNIDWVSLAEELGTTQEVKKEVKEIAKDAQKVAIVNTAMLNLLGIQSTNAIDKKFESTIIFDNQLFEKINYTVESEMVEFKIVGVLEDKNSPAFYLPLSDILVDGLVNASSVKVIAQDPNNIGEIRGSLESQGFQTVSVVDTVDGVSEIFKILRIALLVLGLIALGVASLGMFNTLTVSLLEKTREVGLLKTMGLKSDQVKTLFIAESLIMSVLGGVSGLFLGFIVGKLLSIFVSALSVAQGGVPLDITYIPLMLSLALIIVSAIVGIITGWYPAERAKKISALNALRYE